MIYVLAGGKVDYTSNGTGSVDGITDWVFEIRGVTGYDFPIFSASRITPYLGLGYRYLNDDSAGKLTTTGHSGLNRESKLFLFTIRY